MTWKVPKESLKIIVNKNADAVIKFKLPVNASLNLENAT